MHGELQFPLSLRSPTPVDIVGGDDGQPIFLDQRPVHCFGRRKNSCILKPKRRLQ